MLRQGLDLVGDHREVLAYSPARADFDDGVQRQPPPLHGHALNDADDFVDLGGRAEQFTQRRFGRARAIERIAQRCSLAPVA